MSELIISLILTLLGALSAWAAKSLIPYIKSKTTAVQREMTLSLISAAVSAAEQMPWLRDEAGEKKKCYVLGWLDDRSVSIDDDELDALVESAVYALKNG